jgi:hypothetical protein
MMTLRRILLPLLALALISSTADVRAERSSPKRRSMVHKIPAPGSALAAKGIRAWVPTKGGVLVRNKLILVGDAKTRLAERRWAGMRYAVKRHLKATGAKLAPLSYQRLVRKVRQRAEKVFNQHGGTLGSWKTLAIEGGRANTVNAAAWTGGVITVNRPLIDLAFQIGRIVDAGGPQPKIDKQLWQLANYRRGKGTPPSALKRKLTPGARQMAEGIVAGVVLHEMGHAANGHLEMHKPKLWLPGQKNGRDPAAQRTKEREADDFAAQLGARGGAKSPGAMPYFNYYMHIANPRMKAKHKGVIADVSSHPLNIDRYNASRDTLRQLRPKDARVNSLPELGRKLWLPK